MPLDQSGGMADSIEGTRRVLVDQGLQQVGDLPATVAANFWRHLCPEDGGDASGSLCWTVYAPHAADHSGLLFLAVQ
jgi:hypothetical protein